MSSPLLKNNNRKVIGRFETFRQTKFYDLCAATPLIAWYGYCAAHLLPSVAQEAALIKLFIQTDPSVLPFDLVLKTLAHASTLVFFAVLVVMFTLRRVPQQATTKFWARFVALAGTFLGIGIVLLPQQEV